MSMMPAGTSVSFQSSQGPVRRIGYPTVYHGPRPIQQQIKNLSQLFGLDPDSALEFAQGLPDELPLGAEGRFAVPNGTKNLAVLGSTHGEQIRNAFGLFAKVYPGACTNHRRAWNVDLFRQTDHTGCQMRKLSDEQDDPDILIVPAQFGGSSRLANKSVSDARNLIIENEQGGEFGLDALSVISMLANHPERLKPGNFLRVDCPGTECRVTTALSRFDNAPMLYLSEECLSFSTRLASRVNFDSAAVTGFLR